MTKLSMRDILNDWYTFWYYDMTEMVNDVSILADNESDL